MSLHWDELEQRLNREESCRIEKRRPANFIHRQEWQVHTISMFESASKLIPVNTNQFHVNNIVCCKLMHQNTNGPILLYSYTEAPKWVSGCVCMDAFINIGCLFAKCRILVECYCILILLDAICFNGSTKQHRSVSSSLFVLSFIENWISILANKIIVPLVIHLYV